MAKHLIEEGGEAVPVGTNIAVLVDSADDVAAFKDFTAPTASKGEASAAPSPAPSTSATTAQASSSPPPPPPPPPPPQATKSSGAAESRSDAPRVTGERVVASPYAKSLAKEHGISLSALRPGKESAREASPFTQTLTLLCFAQAADLGDALLRQTWSMR